MNASHDPESGKRQNEWGGNTPTYSHARRHHYEPLHISQRNFHKPGRYRAEAFDRMKTVERRVQRLVDDVIAACDQRRRDRPPNDAIDQCGRCQLRVNTQRDDNAG